MQEQIDDYKLQKRMSGLQEDNAGEMKTVKTQQVDNKSQEKKVPKIN